MNGLFLWIGLLITGYISGVIFSQKTITLARKLLIKLYSIKDIKLEILYKWNDWIFIFTASLLLIFTFGYFWNRNQVLQKSDLIQLLIFEATFLTLFYTTVLRNIASLYRNRPIVGVTFDSTEPDDYHWTLMTISSVVNQTVYTISIPTYYIRLKIHNFGKETLNNVEVVIEKIITKSVFKKPFLPLNLHWAFSQSGSERITRIPQGTFRTIDFLEIMKPRPTAQYAAQLAQLKSIDAKRYKELSKGMRSCSIKPNSLSDIYQKGEYTFLLSISADNVRPKYVRMKVEYKGKWTQNQVKMRQKYLNINLLSVDDTK